MFRATNSPILRSTFNWDSMELRLNSMEFHLNRVIGRQQCRCIVRKAVYTVKSAPEDGRICCPNHVGLI
jgi:hypothetical protein